MSNIRVSLSNTCMSALHDRDAARSITRRIMHALSGRIYRLRRRRLGLKGACPRAQARLLQYAQQAVDALRCGADGSTKLDGVAASSAGFAPVGRCASSVARVTRSARSHGCAPLQGSAMLCRQRMREEQRSRRHSATCGVRQCTACQRTVTASPPPPPPPPPPPHRCGWREARLLRSR
jgi:hypothetical protein